MKKEFILNIIILLFINLLIKPFYIFFIEAKVQSTIGDTQFGLYTALFSLIFLHQFINDPGIQNYNTIYLSKNKEEINQYIPNLLGVKLFLLLITILAVFFSAQVIGYEFQYFYLLFKIILILFLSTLFVLLRSIFSSLGQYKKDSFLSGIDRLLLVLVLGMLFIFQIPFDINTFVNIQVVIFGTCSLVVLFLLKNKGIPIIPKFDITFIKTFLKNCLPYTMIIFLTAILMRGDGVMIERMLEDGKTQLGIYAKGYRFIDAANMFGYLFGALLLPMYANKINNEKELSSLFKLAFKTLLVLSVSIGCTFYFYANEIFYLVYKNNIDASQIKAISPLIFGILPIAMTNISGPLLLASEKASSYNKVFGVVVILFILCNLIFIPKYGIAASAWIALCSWTAVCLALFYLVKVNFKSTIDLTFILKSLLYASIGILCFIVSQYIFGQIHWLIKIVVAGIFYLGIMIMSDGEVRKYLHRTNKI